MFHVKLKYSWSLFFTIMLLLSCNVSRQTLQIPDYVLAPNGIENIGNKGLTAFIFENNLKNSPFEKFVCQKFHTDNYLQKQVPITIDNNKYTLIIYDSDEFEKYFNSQNYAVINLQPDNARLGNQRPFIALSLVNEFNEDCLSEKSLLQRVSVNYLKNLKDEYLLQP